MDHTVAMASRFLAVVAAGMASVLGVAGSAVAQHSWPLWTRSQVPDSGIAVLAELGAPIVAAAEECAYVMFESDDPTQSVVWSRTDDDGRSWTPLAPVPFPVAAVTMQRWTQVAAAGDEVVVYSPRGYWATQAPAFAVSPDRGATWALRQMPLATTPDELLANRGAWSCRYGNLLFTTFDRAASWLGPYVIGGTGPVTYGLQGQVVVREGVLHAAWRSSNAGVASWWYASSVDLGISWTPVVPVAAPTAVLANPVHTLAVSDGGIAVLGLSGGNLWCSHSGDGGSSWTLTSRALPQGSGVMHSEMQMLVDGAALALVWREDGPGAGSSLWCLHSQDGGRTWSGAPQLIGAVGVFGPRAVWQATSVRGGFVVVARREYCWSLPCTFEFHPYASNDGGRTWRDFGAMTSAWQGSMPALVRSRSALLGAWRQQWPGGALFGAPQVDCLAGGQTLGGASSGTGSLVPRLGLDRLGLAGAPLGFAVRDGLPGAPAVLAFGFARLPVPFAAGLLTIDPGVCVLMQLGGTASATPGAAVHMVPVAPLGWGHQVAGQAFVLDPQAAAGVACSNGIELRM